MRKNLFKKYINSFNEHSARGEYFMPLLIAVETINRCNSTCEFCPANRNKETRPFAKMSEELFHKIINELADLKFSGYLNLYGNNEPFMDTRIEEWYKYAKETIKDVKMLIYTNGTIMTPERFKKIIPYVDKMIVNNYTENYKLHENIKNIYELVKATPEYWDKDITIQIRYIKEILTNRAGVAPNKPEMKENSMICVMPFTDMTIYPNGNVGLCCNDVLEKTCYGNLNEQSIYEIWTGEKYKFLRDAIGSGRSNYKFCKGCDFVDAGIRNELMSKLKINLLYNTLNII